MLKGQWALITGASSGIGEATATSLARAGCHLILSARRKEKLEALAETLSAEHQVQCLAAPLDVGSKESLTDFMTQYEKCLGQVSILINNAGLARSTQAFDQVSEEDLEEMLNTNLNGLVRLTRRLLPSIEKNAPAHIVNLGSVAGRWTYPGGAVYCASKYAVRALSEGLRMDLMGKKIRVTNIEPGMVETEFSNVRLRDEAQAKAVYQGMTPLAAKDIAETILWCLDRPSHVNVQELVIFPTDQAGVGQVERRSK